MMGARSLRWKLNSTASARGNTHLYATPAPSRNSTTPTDRAGTIRRRSTIDRKSTRLNSSHLVISYAVFCLKKKKVRLLIVRSLPVHVLIVQRDVTLDHM